MSFAEVFQRDAKKSHKHFDITAIALQLPFILLLEETFFRLIPFSIFSFGTAFFLSIFLHLVTHAYDRKLPETSWPFWIFFYPIQTLVTTALTLIYFKWGFWASFLVHLFYDHILLLYVHRKTEVIKFKPIFLYDDYYKPAVAKSLLDLGPFESHLDHPIILPPITEPTSSTPLL